MGKVKVRSEAQCALELGRPTRMGFTQANAETSYPRKEAEVTVALGSSPLRHKKSSYGCCVCCKHGGKHCGCSPKWQRSRDGMRKYCLRQEAVDCAKNCIQGAIQASGNRWSVTHHRYLIRLQTALPLPSACAEPAPGLGGKKNQAKIK